VSTNPALAAVASGRVASVRGAAMNVGAMIAKKTSTV